MFTTCLNVKYLHSANRVFRMCFQNKQRLNYLDNINPSNAELNPIYYFLALLGAHHFLHVSRIRVKQLVTQKRRARARWQEKHTPEDRRHFNNANNKLRSAFHELNNDTFTAYITSLRCEDQTIWRPTKSRNKPRTPHPPIRANTNPPSPWAKRDTEKNQPIC